jgi:hypothetical protein
MPYRREQGLIRSPDAGHDFATRGAAGSEDEFRVQVVATEWRATTSLTAVLPGDLGGRRASEGRRLGEESLELTGVQPVAGVGGERSSRRGVLAQHDDQLLTRSPERVHLVPSGGEPLTEAERRIL